MTIQMPLYDMTGGGTGGGATVVDPGAADPEPQTVVAGAPTGTGTPTAPDFQITDDENQVTTRGHKYVRQEALEAERQRASGYVDTLNQLKPLMPQFEEFLRQRGNTQRADVSRATQGAPEDQYTEDELNGYAITRGYYRDVNGTRVPDMQRAKDDLDIMTAIADRRASRHVRPLADMTAADRAAANRNRVGTQEFVDGDLVAGQQYLDAVFQSVPSQLTSDPQTANVLAVLAAGLEALDQRRSGQRRGRGRGEPVFREGAGARAGGADGTLDALDRAAARARGKSPQEWAKTVRTVTGDVLE